MIKIDKNIISDKEKFYNYFNELNEDEEIKNNCFYGDFYLTDAEIKGIINIIIDKLNNGYDGDFYLYSDEEVFYTMFNENFKKDALIIDLLERLDNPVNYLLLNLFCEPSNQYWYNKLFEIKYNIMLTTEKLFYNCYTKQE